MNPDQKVVVSHVGKSRFNSFRECLRKRTMQYADELDVELEDVDSTVQLLNQKICEKIIIFNEMDPDTTIGDQFSKMFSDLENSYKSIISFSCGALSGQNETNQDIRNLSNASLAAKYS